MAEPMPNENPVTQAQFAEFKATLRADIRALDLKLNEKIDDRAKTLVIEIVRTNGRIDQLEDSLRREMRENTDRILSFLEPTAKRIESNNNAIVLHGHALMEAQAQLDDHERRLKALEANPRPNRP